MEEVKNNVMQLVVDDGSRRYEIKNTLGEVVGEFTLTPTDLGIYERYAKMQEEIEAIVKPMEGMGEDADLSKFTVATEETKERLFAAINRMFGGDVAGKLFGKLHPFTPVNGRFYFDRVLEVVGAQINAVFESEAVKFGEHVEKYTNRAHARKGGKKHA
ncbi:MAG: hypothetical protein II008_18285 [Oscillospiraceae bacterium]|nr:hypothetical protein [Oscillospiraceae bacterium]MBQ1805465.1 hypothetical protein [Oscillospiraceae bacterium]